MRQAQTVENGSACLTQRLFTGVRERFAFYAASFFRDMSYAVLGYLSYFYIDILGLSGIALSAIMVIGRFWDGLNDPILGVYFDKKATKNGKAMPFFKRTCIPAAILIVVMFSAPVFSSDAKVNYALRTALALVSYLLFETFHTLNGTAFMTLYNSISPNSQERNSVISAARMFSNMGSAIIYGIVPVVLSFFRNDDILAKTYIYFGTAVFVAVSFLLYNSLIIRNVKERVFSASGGNQRIKDMFRGFFKNKLLLLLMASNTIGGLVNAGNTSLWFFTYNMGNPALQTIIGLSGLPTLLLGTYLTPKLTKRYEKNQIVIGCAFFQVLINIVYLILGYKYIAVVVMSFMLGLYLRRYGVYCTGPWWRTASIIWSGKRETETMEWCMPSRDF